MPFRYQLWTAWLALFALAVFAANSCSDGNAPTVIAAPNPTPLPPAPAAECRTVTADIEYRCPYHPIDNDRHNMTFTDLTDGATRLADAGDVSGQSDLLFDPLHSLGWATLTAVVSPGLDRVLTAKQRIDCGGVQECLLKLFYVYHDEKDPTNADDDEWVHVNVSSFGLPQPYEVHGWSTWLHNDLALFNALAAPNGTGWTTTQEENTPQIYALKLTGSPRVELYAPNKLEDQNCLTGRINAQPPRALTQCFDGQRVSVVRRCYNEPVSATTNSLWNTRIVDDPNSGTCVPGGQAQVPVLRTYVMEIDALCEPKNAFSELAPAHIPWSAPENKSMGVVPEWGEMLSAISDDGGFLALGVNRVDQTLLATTDCPGFRHNLTDPNNELSGNATRHTHVCELNASLQCKAEPIPIPTQLSPIEGLVVPGFLPDPETGEQSLVLNRVFAPYREPGIADIVRADKNGGEYSVTPLHLEPATGAMVIRRVQDH